MKKAGTTKCRQGCGVSGSPTVLMAVNNFTAVSWKVYIYLSIYTQKFVSVTQHFPFSFKRN